MYLPSRTVMPRGAQVCFTFEYAFAGAPLPALPRGLVRHWLGTELQLDHATTYLFFQLASLSVRPTLIGLTLDNPKAIPSFFRLLQRLGIAVYEDGEDFWSTLERAHNLSILRPEWATPVYLPYVGPWSPKAVLVGETLSPRAHVPIPFHLETGSSVFLTDVLENWGLTREVGLTNADALYALPTHLLTPIVALGRRSQQYIKTAYKRDVPFVNHPQFVSRFGRSSVEDYGIALAAAVEQAAGGSVFNE